MATRLGEAPEWAAAAALLRCSSWGSAAASRTRPGSDGRRRDTHEDKEAHDVTQREPVTRVAVLIPTYNERENLPGIVARVRASVPTADVIVLDDNSPDGTGEIADGLAAADPQVRVVHRAAQAGPRPGLPRRLRDRPRRGLRRRRRDGRRRLAPARAAARAPRRAGRRRPRHRRPLGQGRRGAQLAAAPQGALGRRERLHQGDARHARQRRDRRLPRLPHERAAHDGPGTASSRRATASRST